MGLTSSGDVTAACKLAARASSRPPFFPCHGPWHRGRVGTLGLDENNAPVVIESGEAPTAESCHSLPSTGPPTSSSGRVPAIALVYSQTLVLWNYVSSIAGRRAVGRMLTLRNGSAKTERAREARGQRHPVRCCCSPPRARHYNTLIP